MQALIMCGHNTPHKQSEMGMSDSLERHVSRDTSGITRGSLGLHGAITPNNISIRRVHVTKNGPRLFLQLAVKS